MLGAVAGMSPSDESLVKQVEDFLNIQQKELRVVRCYRLNFLMKKLFGCSCVCGHTACSRNFYFHMVPKLRVSNKYDET
jgi:hypothetical protein